MGRAIVGFAAALNFMALAACGLRYEDPLCELVTQGETDTLERLLATGELDARSERGHAALTCAARSNRTETLSALLRAGADPTRLDAAGNRWTPLLHATHKHSAAAIALLLGAGANPNIGSPSLTPLIMAAGSGYADIVKLLLDYGADPHAETSDGVTVLGAAVGGAPDIDRFTVGECQTETVRVLLEHAPDLRLQDRFWDRWAIRFARVGGCSEVLNLVGKG